MRAWRFGVAAVSASIGGVAAAQPHEGDIELAVVNGRIVTGVAGAEGFEARRTFMGEFGSLGENITNEPGFDCAPGTFPPGSNVWFTISRAVRVWDGVAFAAIADERIAVSFSAFPPPPPVVSPPVDWETVSGFSLPVGPDGRWHHHLEYTLQAPAEAGVYLFELQLSNSEAPRRSRPFWLVLNKQRPEEEHAAAAAWVYVLDSSQCPSDANRDRAVNSADISHFLAAWIANINCDGESCLDGVDIDDNGLFNSADISAFLSAWIDAVAGGC